MNQEELKKQFGEAVDTLGKYFPEEAAKLAKHREAIVDHIFRGVEPAPDSLLARMKHESIPETAVKGVDIRLTTCEDACLTVVFDVVNFVCFLAGLNTSGFELQIAISLRVLFSPDTLRGFVPAIQNFTEARGSLDMAKAILPIVGEVNNAGCFRVVFEIAKARMSWWEWLKTALTALAYITAWTGSDGAAFIVEAAAKISHASRLIEDAPKAVKACSS